MQEVRAGYSPWYSPQAEQQGRVPVNRLLSDMLGCTQKLCQEGKCQTGSNDFNIGEIEKDEKGGCYQCPSTYSCEANEKG